MAVQLTPGSLRTLKRAREEDPPPTPEFDLLCTIVSLHLKDNPNQAPIEAANDIYDANPDISLSFLGIPSQTMQGFANYLLTSRHSPKKRQSIFQVLEKLQIVCLFKSKFEKETNVLEARIADHLQATAREPFHALIHSAKAALASSIPKNLSELTHHAMALNKEEANISEALALFFYIDPETKESIALVANQPLLDDDVFLYPACKEFFEQLCQNLTNLSEEKSQLLQLLGAIREKLGRVKAQITDLHAIQESKLPPQTTTAMIADKERFFNAETSFFWKMGGKLLTDAFIQTLYLRKKSKPPRGLVSAMKESAKLDPAWRDFEHHKLFPKKNPAASPNFSEGYVSNIWGYFANVDHLTDVGDLMRQFLNTMPEHSFDNLRAANAKERETILQDAFVKHFKGEPNFETLKKWALELKPLE